LLYFTLMFRVFLLSLIFVSALPVSAATLYLDPSTATLNRGDALVASVRLIPDKDAGECINAVDAVINYTDNIQPVDVSIGKSIFNIWVEKPTINREKNQITFAGGIPNGYCGRVDGDPMYTNIIAEIVFRSPGVQIGATDTSREAVIEFGPETIALLNDGQGTRANLGTLGSVITLEKTAGSTIVDTWRDDVRADRTPPEKFSIELVRDDTGVVSRGRYYIVFSTTDKQTGVSHYEIMEEPISEFKAFKWGEVGVPWITANSPYVLKDQNLNSIIRVKAVDKAGNEYIATLVPDESLRTLSQGKLYNYLFIGVALGVVLITVAVVLIFRRRRKSILVEKNNSENYE